MYYYLILLGFFGATCNNNKKENKTSGTSKNKRAAVQISERRTRSAFFLDTPVINERMKRTRILFQVSVTQKWCIVRVCNANCQTREG
jgi:hypothetical protein